ncbi:pyruvate, phosphate dikinase [Micromonospora sp. ATCC 39149]|uniref:Pyruvate n=1 Tax=Micromonospora carbonacea TaxID=47853 RepID=A0A7D5YG97_9ACTN|nr:PEP/pyruvate-binding domain-containing protein [Micromonospora sp. ATCC 39149]EEP70553.1 pyruvate, phosphate dikinase [Micromonospora sp. ATCC 39149]QLJ96934.1 pyruvate [Micromonospora carbonacea]
MTAPLHRFPDGPGPVLGSAPDPALLGGKGAGLVRMARLGLPVPPGFVLTTAAVRGHRAGRLSPALRAPVRAEVEELARRAGRGFGAGPDPLTVSVRSGAPESMPGMLDTVLDVGRLGGEQAWHDLDAAIGAVLRSWGSERAVAYRRRRGLDDASGTAVVVQTMVDGRAAGLSGTGVLFTRDPATGAPGPTGEYLAAARGPDLVDGVRTPEPLGALARTAPGRYAELTAAADRLERELTDMCEIEFTVERGVLWLLQVRPGKRTPRAARRIAVDLAHEGRISRAEAARRAAGHEGAGAWRTIAATPADRLLCRGLAGSPGAATGRIALDATAVEQLTGRGEPVILVRPFTEAADLPAMLLAAGVLTAAGGVTSHAAVVARELGVPCVCGATGLEIDLTARRVRMGGRELAEGTEISIDGAAGTVTAGRSATTADAGNDTDDHLRRLLDGWATAGRSIHA